MDLLLELSKRIDNGRLNGKVKIDFYGQKTDDYYNTYLSRVPYYEYKGILAPDEVIDRLGEYDVLIFPTHYEGEGCPGILIEALSAGVPIVASDWKYNGEFIINGINGYLCSVSDVSEYERSLISLALNPRLRYNMGMESKRMSQKFSHTHASVLMAAMLSDTV